MAKMLIDEKDTRNISFKALGFYLWLKANSKIGEHGNILSYTEIEQETNMIYLTTRKLTKELEEKGYIKLIKKGIPVKIYVTFLK